VSRHRAGISAAAAAVALVLSACSAGAGSRPAAPAVAAAPGLEHVHGLGVDPADGVLYAATHFGLWRLPEEGPATRVADRFQDTMGFTVIGDRTFLGSGHPDFQMDPELPTRLGLIRSVDAGETWESLSLSGAADFHVLRALPGRIVGWDAGSGQVMVSQDEGRSWQTRSTLELRDLVVSPAVPETLLAATESGVLRSDDAGRTWASVPGAPPLSVLAWATADSLYGVSPDGVLQHSVDRGASWVVRGEVGGEPEALAVTVLGDVETLYVAVSGRGILASTDGGATFTVRYAE
jgi:photosystem II stability/assembly factor-like uncharacterized protein